MNPFEIATILSREITEEQRKAALISTAQLLRKIDIHGIEKMRQHFELPPEALGIITELYCMMLVSPAGMRRAPMPISNLFDVIDGKHVPVKAIDGVPGTKLLQGKMRTVRAKPRQPFTPVRLIIGNTGEGTKMLVIDDIRIDGRTQFLQAGGIPGDMFQSTSIDSFVHFQECKEMIEIDVTYVGDNPNGVDVLGAFIGITNGTPSELLIEDASDVDGDQKATPAT